MKFILHVFVILVSAMLGLAVGFAWKNRPPAPGIKSVVSTTNQSLINRTRTVKRHAGTARDDSPLATQLERDLSTTTGVARWLHWMSALEKAQPSDFPRLAKLAHGNPTAWRFVVNRWIEIAPQHLCDTLIANLKNGGDLPDTGDLGWKLFSQWSKRDPEAAIAAVSGGSRGGIPEGWRHSVASAVIANDAERGLEIMYQWHINNFGPRMDAVEKWASADPRHAAEFALAHPAGYVSEMTIDTIGKQWAAADPKAALAYATAQSGELNSRLAATVLKEWAGQNLTDAATWLAGVDDSARSRFSPAFIETWAKQDAPSALSWCQDNLQGLQLAQAVGGLMRGAVEKDLPGAAALVAGMAPSPARSEAAEVVAQKWFPEFSSGDPVKPEAIAWLSGLDTSSVKRVLDGMATVGWATSDPKSLARFLSSAGADAVPTYTDARLAREMVRSNPIEALDWAASLPESRGITAGADAFAEWRKSQPDAATAWLDNLPSTDSRRQPFFEAMVRTLAYEPQAPEQFAAMSASDRAAAQAVIGKMSLPDDQRRRLLDSLKPH